MPLLIPTEDNIEIELGTMHGHVVLKFNRPVTEVPIKPQLAAEIARTMAEAVQYIVSKEQPHLVMKPK